MKKINITTILLLLLSFSVFAQNGKVLKRKKEQVKAMKVAFITNELNLNPEEATKFWPLFNAFEEKQHEIRREKLKNYLDRLDDNAFENLSEKEAVTILAQMESTEDELYKAKKKFITSIKGVISPIKILKLKKAEENFNKKLLQQYRDKKLVK
ncbi:MAG: sensor of ECF-type sigma factor [Flavobacterium sp.]|uniref:sensor of ECF-type sigma factor n=1 Tax=Flavobacterium sp. TaxID=239 RepID=UPI003BDA4E34